MVDLGPRGPSGCGVCLGPDSGPRHVIATPVGHAWHHAAKCGPATGCPVCTQRAAAAITDADIDHMMSVIERQMRQTATYLGLPTTGRLAEAERAAASGYLTSAQQQQLLAAGSSYSMLPARVVNDPSALTARDWDELAALLVPRRPRSWRALTERDWADIALIGAVGDTVTMVATHAVAGPWAWLVGAAVCGPALWNRWRR